MTDIAGSEPRLLLRIEEAAERLGIGRSLMYRLVLSGAIESVPVGYGGYRLSVCASMWIG